MVRGRLPGRTPARALVAAAVAGLLLLGPLAALLARAPWGDLPALVAGPVVLPALALSFGTALAASGICVLLGVPLAVALAGADRWPAPLRRVTRALVTTPLVLPPVVSGIALLLLLGRTGLVGQALQLVGVTIPYSTAAVVIAEAFVSLPFLVLSVEGALRGVDARFAASAATLGAGPWRVLTRVTLPLAAPGVVAGAVLAFARSLGEFGATITFAGNLPGVTQTLPVAAYIALTTDYTSAIAIAVFLVLLSLVVLLSLRERWLRGIGG